MPVFPNYSINSEHFVRLDLGSGRVSYTLTGVVVGGPMAGTGSNWSRGRLEFTVPVRALGDGKALRLSHWAPFIALRSISNDHTATFAGWAVDSFGLVSPKTPIRRGVTVFCDVAVRDIDGFINRLSYNIHLLGSEV
jgi:hypothetical protein